MLQAPELRSRQCAAATAQIGLASRLLTLLKLRTDQPCFTTLLCSKGLLTVLAFLNHDAFICARLDVIPQLDGTVSARKWEGLNI